MEQRVLTIGNVECKWRPNQNGFASYLLTQTQLRCLNYQYGWKISLPNAPQDSRVNIFWMLQPWSVTIRERNTRGCFLLHNLEMFAVSPAPFIWGRQHLSSQLPSKEACCWGLEERLGCGWRWEAAIASPLPPGWWGKGGGDLTDPPFPLWGARMWGSVMLNTQWQGLGDPENHPFTFKAYSAISIISHEEGILL